MLFEVKAEVKGNIVLKRDIEINKHPYTIRLFFEKGKYYISFLKRLINFEGCIPTLKKEKNGIPIITLPKQDFYSDAIKTIQHIESFAALNNRLKSIDTVILRLKWIPENENEHISPFNEV